MKRSSRGFTVLELLIVIAIICILLGLILAGLTEARQHAEDEDRASNVQNIVVGLVQYFDVCGVYPATLTNPTSVTCPALQGKTLEDIIPNIGTYNSDPNYAYFGLADPNDPSMACTGFHIGVKLLMNEAGFSNKSGAAPQPTVCTGSASPDTIDGTQPTVFDIKK